MSTDNEGGVPDVPEVQVEDPHLKVGDGTVDYAGVEFVVGQIALVGKGPEFDLVCFDTLGKERGRLHLRKIV